VGINLLQVPVLFSDDRPISQTGSILRYISHIGGKDVQDAVLAAQADSAFEAAQEMPMAQVYVAVNLMEEAELRESAKVFREALPQYLTNWSKLLGSKHFFHGETSFLPRSGCLPSVAAVHSIHSGRR
jgi:glutathione S-transferase